MSVVFDCVTVELVSKTKIVYTKLRVFARPEALYKWMELELVLSPDHDEQRPAASPNLHRLVEAAPVAGLGFRQSTRCSLHGRSFESMAPVKATASS